MLTLYFFVLFSVSCCYGNVLATNRDCGGLIVVDDTVVMDGPFHENCILQFQSQENRVLAFSVVAGNINIAAKDFLVIHDGVNADSPIIQLENQMTHDVPSIRNLPATFYTTFSKASVRFLKAPPSDFQLKIQKAVDCPFNLGIDTQCGRVVDQVSCYCALFTNRNQTDQTMVCIDNKMKLFSLESLEEEVFINAAWGTSTRFLTSLTDSRREAYWIWESTMTYPTYYNWGPGEPNNTSTDEDCMFFISQIWVDISCSYLAHAICEAQP